MPRVTKSGETAKTATKKAATAKTAPKEAPAKKGAKAAKAGSAPKAKAPARKTGDAFLESQRKALEADREMQFRHASTLRAEAEQLAEDREPGDVQFDEESGQGDSMNVERERDLALSAQALAAVEEIDRALVKIDLGTYGACERCGEPIPKERLRAIPHAALCVRCKSGGLSRR